MDKLDRFISNNKINIQDFKTIIYQSFLLSIFRELYHYLEDEDNKETFKIKIRNANSHSQELSEVRRLICEAIGNVYLETEELERILELLKAYLSKSNYRKKLSMDEKRYILQKQNNLCNICGKPICMLTAHIDHVIPFKFVGDELDNNLQGLCEGCNLSKGTKLIHLIEIFLKQKLVKNTT